ncbi:MAG: hypothetical protein JST55_04290 [Bacteroidetes bacterium]|nr:hypothetical protein [Bacteroidota bacterium]
MKKIQHLLIIFSLVFLFFPDVNTYSQTKTITTSSPRNYALTLKLSTLGVGLDGTTNIANNLNVRIGGQFFKFSVDGGKTGDDYIYTAKTTLLSFSALLDYFPGGSIFKISGGLLVNLNKVDIDMTPGQTYVVNGKTYNKDNLGKVNSYTDFTKVNPYLGIGLCNPLNYKKFGFTMDIGTVYQFEPQVTMTATGLISPTASQANIVQDNIKWFKVYPVVTLGLTYKFN